jgi:CRISPR-associated endoribonuclease Cas6
MRFRISFRLLGEPPFYLPENYQSEFSAWIHKMLHFEIADFSSWLKRKGYTDASGEYRLYTFSDVLFGAHKHHGNKLVVEQDHAEMLISFYADAQIEDFLRKIFEKQEFKIGDQKGKVAFRVEMFEKIPEPSIKKGKGILLSCLSPMLISDGNLQDNRFLAPDDKGFEKAFIKSLLFKYANLVKFMSGEPGKGLPDLQNLKFKLAGKPKTKIVKINSDSPHQKSVKGYLFDFEISAPEELLKIGLNSGFGELNHLGFGCCDLKKKIDTSDLRA